MDGDSDPNALPPALPAGFPRPFGPYLLLSSYGRGGMGEVFLAQRQVGQSEELCVLKTLRRDLCTDKSYVRRFLDEARIVVRLEHPNICAVYDVGQAGDEYFMTMEHIAGTNLRELLANLVDTQERLAPDIALWFGSEMLAALSWAHHATDPETKQLLNVVHRDVSPHNVMVTFDGGVKLIDFGLAESALKQEQTESHVVMGKVSYMSPEQARGDDVDATCDQFAAAIVIYECLTQDRYYGDLTTPRIWAVAGLGTFEPRYLHELAPELQAVLKKALAADPRERFKSCNEFREAIDAIRRKRGMSLGRDEAAALMAKHFADRIASHKAIAKAYSSTRATSSPAAARSERPINFVATRSGAAGLGALTSSVPAPNVGDFTERVDRGGDVFASSNAGGASVEATARVVRNTGSFAPVQAALPARSSSRTLIAAAAAAMLAIGALALVVTRPWESSAAGGTDVTPVTNEPVATTRTPTPTPVVANPVNPTPTPVVTPPVVDDTKPVDGSKPTDATPIDANPRNTKPVDAKPVDAKPLDKKIKKPVETKQVDAESADVKPANPKPTHTAAPTPVVDGSKGLDAKELVFGYETTKRVLDACTTCPEPIAKVVRASTSAADIKAAVCPAVNRCVDKCMKAGIR